MGETNFDKLQRLRQESERFYQQSGQNVFSSQCPGSADQHNREIEIARLSRSVFPGRGDAPENSYRALVNEVMDIDL